MIQKPKYFVAFSLVFLVFLSIGFSQSQETGALEGTVKDDEGRILPGVEITISSPRLMGIRSTATDEKGKYRFVLLPAGIYTVEASLKGFNPVKRENIRVHASTVFVIDFTLAIATVQEEITVTGTSPTVDVQDSSSGKLIITSDFLQNMPSARTLQEIFGLAPGVESNSSFGGGEWSSNAFYLDGADLTEGKWGGGWIDVNYNTLEEFQITGRGAPAEFGGFTGSLVNAVSKAGGNHFEGMVEFRFQGTKWSSSNYKPDDPRFSLLAKAPEERYMDGAFHLGGPIIKDKLWFFAAFSFLKMDIDVAGYDVKRTDQYPLGFLKLTFQPNVSNRIQVFGEVGSSDWLRLGLSPLWGPEATTDIHNRKFAWNASGSHTFSPNTFMEVKVAGYRAPQYGDPAGGEDIPGHYDLSTGALTGNYPYIIKYLLNRFQAHATLTHNKENFIVGDHQFKAGVAYSRFSGDFTIKTTGGLFYYDNVPGLWPGPGLAISQGWNQVPTSNQVSFFVQDSWSVTRNFTLNPGIRFEIYRGYLKHLDKTVIKASDFLPRIGFTWDIFGDHKTALKAHYGKYNERLLLGYFEDMDTGYDDNVTYLVLPTGDLVELSRIPLAKLTAEIYSIDPNIKQPTMHEFTAGIDRELISDLSFGVSFIYRKWTNFIDQVNTGGIWEPLQVTGPDGQVYTVYNRLNPGADKYYITNPEPGKDYGQAYKNIVSIPVWRKYTGVEFLINKKFSNKWQLLASYVYSKATGTLSNGYRSSYGKAYLYKDPNNQILAQGHLEIDPTHMLKIQGTAVLPLEFNLTGNLSVVSGRTWAKTLAVGGLAQGVVWIPIEPRGSERLPTRTNLDFRVEKTLNLKNFGRIGIMFDMFNAFNSGVETGLIGAVNQSNYGLVTGIVLPRRYRLGIRFFF